MNEILKQRIVGAIVITALAAIFVPMLFDDPVSEVDDFNSPLVLPVELTNDTQALLDNIPKSAAQILARPTPVQVDLQAKSIQKAAAVKDTLLKSWTIQVASFSLEKNANKFRDKLRKSNFTAYVDSVSNRNGTLYRVRVGPELDEKRAIKTKQELESSYKIKTLLVSG